MSHYNKTILKNKNIRLHSSPTLNSNVKKIQIISTWGLNLYKWRNYIKHIKLKEGLMLKSIFRMIIRVVVMKVIAQLFNKKR